MAASARGVGCNVKIKDIAEAEKLRNQYEDRERWLDQLKRIPPGISQHLSVGCARDMQITAEQTPIIVAALTGVIREQIRTLSERLRALGVEIDVETRENIVPLTTPGSKR